jgi:signal peptidase I
VRRLITGLGGAAAGLAGLAWLRHRLLVVTVTGTSMQPAFQPGDRVLVRRAAGRVRVGAVLIFAEPPPGPAESWVVKRVAAVAGDAVPAGVRPAVDGAATVPPGMLVMLGDGTRSRDSRQWGFVPASQVLGVAVRRLPRRAR